MKTECDTERGREGDAATRFGGSSLLASWRLSVLAVMSIASCLVPSALRPASAHEPITTKVRFNKEVVRILQRSCLGCHRAGGIAMSLATYEEARPWAKAIKEEVLEKRMPPWHAVKGYGEFRNAPSLPQRDVDLLVNWVEGGAPKGEDKDLPAGPLFSSEWQLGKPDLTLKPESESKIAGDADEQRIFLLSTGLKEDRWLKAIDLQPGNGFVVHCATIYSWKEEANAQLAPMLQGGREDPAAESLRFASVLATWMPGQRTVAIDEGIGRSLPAGSRLALKIHYRGSGEPSTDLSAIGLYFTGARPSRQIRELRISGADSVISVAAEPLPFKASFNIDADTQAVAIRPRVHPLMNSFQATAYRPDGSQEVLVWTRGYHFDWNPTYYFKQPVSLPKGTRVEITVYFDNSDENRNNPNDPAKPVRWSELTADPWAVFLFGDRVQ